MRGSGFKKRCIGLLAIFIVCFSTMSYAHPGRTDRNGGHKDNKNKSGLGSYHYHCDGYEAHLHPNGYCPYSSSSISSTTDYNSNFVENSVPIVEVEEKIDEEQEIENIDKIEDDFVKEENFVQEVTESIKEPIKNEILENKEVSNENEAVKNKDLIEKEETVKNKETFVKEEKIENKEEPVKEEIIENKEESVKEEMDEEVIHDNNETKEQEVEKTESNEKLDDETEDSDSSGGIGAVLLLGGTGYLVYKKIRD